MAGILLQGSTEPDLMQKQGVQQRQHEENPCCVALEAELLRLLRHSRQQMQELQQHRTEGADGIPGSSSSNNSIDANPAVCGVDRAAGWANLLQVCECFPLLIAVSCVLLRFTLLGKFRAPAAVVYYAAATPHTLRVHDTAFI